MSQQYRKWVTDLVKQLGHHLNLLDWRVGLEFDGEAENLSDGCVAFTRINARYLDSHIVFTPLARQLYEDGEMSILRDCVIHEVCHILLNPLHEFAKQAASPQTEPQLTDILEQATQRFARIVAASLPKKSLKA